RGPTYALVMTVTAPRTSKNSPANPTKRANVGISVSTCDGAVSTPVVLPAGVVLVGGVVVEVVLMGGRFPGSSAKPRRAAERIRFALRCASRRHRVSSRRRGLRRLILLPDDDRGEQVFEALPPQIEPADRPPLGRHLRRQGLPQVLAVARLDPE